MGKILQFKKIAPAVQEMREIEALLAEVDDDISAIVNDFSLTPANRRWLLENMLMDIDDKLEHYKQQLHQAERRLALLVKASEQEIEAAYSEYIACVKQLTHSVNTVAKTKSTAKA
jgi:septal ring factor EnvC (AmiA/AmiB activator)